MDKLRLATWHRWFLSGITCAAIVSTCLLAYASIVPLQYSPLSWDETLARWNEVPWLRLGVYHRADWVANALGVIPPGFFAMGAVWFACRGRGIRIVAAIGIAGLLCELVYAIECFQIWFPPRTVSQNDLLAGCVGAVAGPAAWIALGPTAARRLAMFLTLPTIGRRLQTLALFGVAGAVGHTVFPLDLVVTSAEFQKKWDSGRLNPSLSIDLLTKTETIQGGVLAAARMFPVGLWFGLAGYRFKRCAVMILLAAAGLEAIQIPIYSKHAIAWEVVAGFLGGLCAWWLGSGPKLVTPVIRSSWPWGLAIAAFTLVAPLGMLTRFDAVVADPELLASRWRDLWTPPLLRYYYTSEFAALTNLAGKLGVFACFGGAVVGFGWASGAVRRWPGFLFGLLLGAGIEIAQVYLLPLFADATDVVIYTLGYCAGYVIGYVTLYSGAERQMSGEGAAQREWARSGVHAPAAGTNGRGSDEP